MAEARSVENVYLGEVLEQQAKVDQELRRRAPASAQALLPRAGGVIEVRRGVQGPADGGGGAPPGRAIDYRVTGFWRWRTVVVPPNVYVVHTRRGADEPVTIGLGISFPYDPYTDAFLLIPAAMQTIVINARCICIERQGILVQAYVQWIIDDIRIAYRRLDFSDPEDPMRIVNVQLREQAEAAIKDKVATMSIDAVLSDKQPIIEELTHRLRAVAEGSREGPDSSGLGLKIVTVQIKEAVVSSTRLWESLQKPFRAEREKFARMAELEALEQIAARELENRKSRQTAELEAEGELAQRRAVMERERYDREQAEKGRRHKLEQEAEQRFLAERNQTEMVRKTAELELALKDLELAGQRIEREVEAIRRRLKLHEAEAERDRAQAAAEAAVEELRSQAQAVRTERELKLFQARRAVENDLSESHVKAQLIARLPEIAAALPQPAELRTVNISSAGSGGTLSALLGFLAGALDLAQDAIKGHGRAKEALGSGGGMSPQNAPAADG
jgi:regulator of protease activity HflC (stomatin/prohibitin superfamily)